MLYRILTFVSISGLLFTTGCFRNNPTDPDGGTAGIFIEIIGLLEGGSGKTVVLEEMGAREFIPVDTVTIDESGAFEISFVSDEAAFYVLRHGHTGYVTLLLEPGESIEFSGTIGKTDPYQVSGSEGSELLRALSSKHKHALNALGEVTRQNRELVSSPDYSRLKPVLDGQFDSITAGFYEYSLEFIHQNAGSLAILVALYNLYGQGLPVFHPETDLHVYRFVDSALMSGYSGFDAVDLLHAQLMEADQSLKEEYHVPGLQKGEIAPDFVSSRPDGQQMALSDLRGNYVLLSFWAGWSRLSREENSVLKQAYEMYSEHPFKILQVSLDDERGAWIGAIREDALAWDHVSELRRWETVVADLYHVEKIPSNVLIDPDGRIVETDLLGDKLLEKLGEIFSK
ncbi:MAG: redoxin domain-containing protein [Bacteroidales bacterium]|nr:redoxin domain-containing protein [Bacteroidales bacterium]